MNDYELYHHGIKGMKWGVRRYQNYDGSYTKKGLARYRQAESEYDKAKETSRQTKAAYKSGAATKEQYTQSKGDLKTKKRELDNAYDKLKTDYRADEGKKLYQKGKTITGNTRANGYAQMGVIAGSYAVQKVLEHTLKDKNVAYATGLAIRVGGTAVNAILYGKTQSDNRKLRAYYGH